MIALRKKGEHRVAEPRASCQARTLAQRCEAAMLCMTAENSSLVMIINALEDLGMLKKILFRFTKAILAKKINNV